MSLISPKLPVPFRRGVRRSPAQPLRADDDAGAEAAPVREPDEDTRAGAGAEATDLGWRSSSHDLKQGLDVVELPTSLPVDVLDRLFNAPDK